MATGDTRWLHISLGHICSLTQTHTHAHTHSHVYVHQPSSLIMAEAVVLAKTGSQSDALSFRDSPETGKLWVKGDNSVHQQEYPG